MSSLYLLIPLGLFFVAIAVAFFVYATRSGQYEDLDKAARSVLEED